MTNDAGVKADLRGDGVRLIGDRCETAVNECASNPCQQGGICEDQVNGFTCTCPRGFTGAMCENDVDECASNPCQQNGTCEDQVNGFTCTCPPGFTDGNCETDVNECASNPCQQGGTCEDQVNGFTCTCPPGFTDKLCSVIDQSSTVTAKSTLSPGEVDTSDYDSITETTSHTWLYVSITFICVVLLAAMALCALCAFLCTKRRKTAEASLASLSWLQLTSLSQQSSDSASVDVEASSKPCCSTTGLDATDFQCRRLSDSCTSVSNLYESIDDVPDTDEGVSAASPPEAAAAAAAAAASCCDVTDGVDCPATNDSSGDVGGLYINDVPTTSPTSSPSPAEPAPAPAAAAASGASFYAPMDKPHLKSSSASPPTQPTAPPQSPPEAEYLIHPSISNEAVPCIYQLECNAQPNDGDNVE